MRNEFGEIIDDEMKELMEDHCSGKEEARQVLNIRDEQGIDVDEAIELKDDF